MEGITILALLKKMEKGKWYHVPEDYYLSNYVYLEYSDAGYKLIDIFNYWSKKMVFSRFKMDRVIEMPVHDPFDNKMKIRKVVRITMVNKEFPDEEK